MVTLGDNVFANLTKKVPEIWKVPEILDSRLYYLPVYVIIFKHDWTHIE